jgi:cytochrome c-type biogenesis protein CcmF
MIEFGESALISLILISAFQAFIPLVFCKASSKALCTIAKATQYFQLFLILFAFSSLVYAYITTDLRVANVVLNSHHHTPLLYKITGVWGNHEGSMLLWVSILVIYGSGVALLSSAPFWFKAKVLSLQSVLTCLFTLFIYLTSNPFLKISNPGLSGHDLNPLLQDPALAFHPPFLYGGFVGFSIIFSFAGSALLEKKPDLKWVVWARPWALIAWSSLTLGITLGSWWAYYELGWGGWWFWDPVENISLIPWLLGTALIHVFTMLQKREFLGRWLYLLSLLSFLSSLGGTFLIRSGVLSSVHAFASDPKRGLFLLIIGSIVSFLSLGLFIVRLKHIPSYFKKVRFMSRENAIFFNNILLVTLAFTVALGTLYPLFLEAITGDKITVGTPYFSSTFIPLSVPFLIVMGISAGLKWHKESLLSITAHSYFWLSCVLTLTTVGALLFLYPLAQWRAVLMISGGVWIFSLTLTSMRRADHQNSLGMILAHGGLAITILGMGVDTLGLQEKIVALRQGESINFCNYRIKLHSVSYTKLPTYTAEQAIIHVEKNGKAYTLLPEKRFYPFRETLTTETALHHYWFSNLYIALGPLLKEDQWVIRVYYHPLVELIWLGGFFIALGGMIGLIPRGQGYLLKRLLVVLLSIKCLSVSAAEVKENPSQEEINKRAYKLYQEIKCPVCAGQSIEHSNTDIAKDLRKSIHQALLEGKTEQEIRKNLSRLYGEEILFRPVFDAKNLILWLLPFLTGIVGIGAILRRSHFRK